MYKCKVNFELVFLAWTKWHRQRWFSIAIHFSSGLGLVCVWETSPQSSRDWWLLKSLCPMLSMAIEYGPVEEMDDHCCACAVCRTGGERGSSKGRWFTEIPSQPAALGHSQTAAAPDGPGQCWRPDLHHGRTPGGRGAYPPSFCSLSSQIDITMLIQFHRCIMRAQRAYI